MQLAPNVQMEQGMVSDYERVEIHSGQKSVQADLEWQSQLFKKVYACPPAKSVRNFAALWCVSRIASDSCRGAGFLVR